MTPKLTTLELHHLILSGAIKIRTDTDPRATAKHTEYVRAWRAKGRDKARIHRIPAEIGMQTGGGTI